MSADAVELDAFEGRADPSQRAVRTDAHHARFAARGDHADLHALELERELERFSRLQVDVGHEVDAARADVAHAAIAPIEPDPEVAVEPLVSARAHERVMKSASWWCWDGGRMTQCAASTI